MEPFTNWKLPPEPKLNLYPPPPYCRKPGRKDKEKEKGEEDPDRIPHPKLTVSNPSKLMYFLGKLRDNTSRALEVRINKYLKRETDSQVVFIINLWPESEEAVVQAVNDRELTQPIRMPLSQQIMKALAPHSGNTFHVTDLNPQIIEVVKEVLTDISGELITIPILSNRTFRECPPPTEYPVLLLCFVNSKKEESYVSQLVEETLRYCLTLLLNTSEAEEEARQKRQCQSLLAVARKLFSHLEDLNNLLKEIMSEARRITNSERCSLFLLEPDSDYMVAKVFDGVLQDEADGTQVKIGKGQGIAGHVAATGQILNIHDAYKHPLFYKGMDETTGFRTRNILCFPIRDENGIVGVAQLCNKKGGSYDYFDEEMANAFSIYCGISIMHSLIYKRIEDTQARSKLLNELMMYHMKINDEDVEKLLACQNIHVLPNFDTFTFSPRSIYQGEAACFVLKMFEDLGFIQEYSLKRETLARFILFVKKGYRDTPYHNFTHAFCVTHFAYLCIKNFQLVERGYITSLEAFAFFVSCLCHDIDHRGTTNSFQKQSNSTLANLYSSEGSVMERHHLSQTIFTLNSEGCNFLEVLNREDYILVLDLIKDMILATDLATHFKIYQKQHCMVQSGYNKDKAEHRYIFACLLMTCADLSDQAKDWLITKRVAQLVYEEFFAQGDLEKRMGKKPMDMMDREKASVPDLQIDFLDKVVKPVFKLLNTMFPQCKELLLAIKKNKLSWELSKCVFNRLTNEGWTSLEILTSTELELEVQALIEDVEKAGAIY